MLLAVVGWWLYLQLSVDSSYSVSSIQVAGYWFGILIFVLFSWIFYWILHRRSGKAWMIALTIAVIIAIVSTGALLVISRDHEQQRQRALEQSQESEVPKPEAIDPGGVEPEAIAPEASETIGLKELELEPDVLEPGVQGQGELE